MSTLLPQAGGGRPRDEPVRSAYALAMRAVRKQPDLAIYPVNDDMGEHELQRLIAELLRPIRSCTTSKGAARRSKDDR